MMVWKLKCDGDYFGTPLERGPHSLGAEFKTLENALYFC